MQRMKRHLRSSLLIAGFVLSASVICSAQTTLNTTASALPQNPADSETLKALEIANIRLAAANEQIKLLNDRLAAKDEIIAAKDGTIAVRNEQLALAQSANKDRAGANNIDQFRVEACQQQLQRADLEINRLRHPGFFRSVFDTKTITGAIVGYGIGKMTKD